MELSALLWILPTSLVAWITYRYMTASDKTWKDQEIPTSHPFKLVTDLIHLIFNPIHELLLKDYRKYGRLSCQYVFGTYCLSVAEPDMIREILVKDFQNFVDRMEFSGEDPILDNMLSVLKGEKWKRMRTLMSPTFSTGKLKKMTISILACADILRKNLEKRAELNEPVDIKKFVGAFTMDAIASTAFSTKLDSHNDPDNPFVVAARQFFNRSSQWKMMLMFTFNKLIKLLRIKMKNVLPTRFFVKITEQIIEERRKKPEEKRNDFLQLMLNASEKTKLDAPSNAESEKSNVGNGDISSRTPEMNDEGELKEYKGLTDVEIISQCVIFFIGGFENIASAITFTIYELALNVEIQETLIAEIDEALRRNKNELRYEDVQEMKYLDCVVSEMFRKYPSGLALQRIAIDDCVIGEKQIKIPKGTNVNIPIYPMHFDPEYYPDPEKFDPNRFTQEAKASRNSYVYLPFGAGPRNCIAMRFAITEVKVCLAYLLQHFRFHRCSATPVPLKFGIAQTQLLAQGIFVTVEKRKDAITSSV